MKIAGWTIAIEDMTAMVAFYNAAFHCNLQPFEAMGVVLYRGTLAGLPLVGAGILVLLGAAGLVFALAIWAWMRSPMPARSACAKVCSPRTCGCCRRSRWRSSPPVCRPAG